MNEKQLEAAVTATAAVEADWRGKIGALEANVATLNDIITKTTNAREDRALASLLGNPDAKAAIAKARSQQHEAEQELADISRYALPAAKEALAAAEREAQTARTALSHYQADLLKRQRIGIAAQIDDAIAALLLLVEKFDSVGASIANTPDLYPLNAFGTGMGQLDEIRGDRRLRAAISKRFEKIYPGAGFDEKRKESLLDSEVRIWNLPPEQPATQAA
jgi:hypothetical protein